eukprot:gene8543-biopygen6839
MLDESSSSLTGSQQNMQQNYQDGMTIVRKHGKVDIFLTFTANPNWQEILDNLLPNKKPQDLPKIVTRVFNLEFKELLCDMLDFNFFGKVVERVYTVEFQKHALPSYVQTHAIGDREQNAHQYLHQDIPEHYTFNKSSKHWQQRKRRAPKEFQEDPADDYVRHDQLQDPNAAFQQQHIYMCLVDIQNNLHIYGKSLQEFPEIPQLPANYAQPQQADDEINTEQEQEQGQQMLEKLNPEQLQIHSAIVLATETQSTDNCFFLDGQARTGKTFFYNTLVHNLQASGHKVKCVAHSGKAATLLIHCRTAQSKFQIPVPLLHNSTCNVKAQSSQGQQLQDSTQFIWKEASTIPATALKAVDSLLRDITKVHKPFGGKYFVLGGDFRQLLSVIKKAGRERVVQECLKSRKVQDL